MYADTHEDRAREAAEYRRRPAKPDDPSLAGMSPIAGALVLFQRVQAGQLRCQACNAPRAVSPCHKCGAELVEAAAGWDEPELPDIELIRTLAREVGYAVGVHGSLERDLDLIAAPWVEDAVGPEQLAEHIARGINGRVLAPEVKPRGRWSCNIQIDGWYKLIDLSVAHAG